MDSKTAGGNFVDISLKATVRNAADTLIIFKLENKHGTTWAQTGVDRAGVAITFSVNILDAFKKAKAAVLNNLGRIDESRVG